MEIMHPLARDMETARKRIVVLRAKLAVAMAEKRRVRAAVAAEIASDIIDDPGITNVALQAKYGLRSVTTVRRIRAEIEAGAEAASRLDG